MTKGLLFSTLLFGLSTMVSSAQQNDIMVYGKNYFGNTVNESEICKMLGFTSRPEASRAVENIVRRSGLKQNFYVMECPSIDNCFAATRNGERLIVYDPSFMRRINDITQTDWAALSILAHEIGHHLQGHTIKQGGSDHEKELEADEFSGFVMYQMGATLKQAQSAIFKLTSDYPTSTHPVRTRRLKSIEKGYNNAMELYPNVRNTMTSKEPERQVSEPVANNREGELIIGDIVIKPNHEMSVYKLPEPEVVKKKTGCIDGDCWEGFGVMINSKTNEKFAGGWKNGKRAGRGTEFYNDGLKKYEGEYLNGVFNGTGTYFFKTGEKYVGKFRNGQMHGQNSVFHFRNGDRIVVDYVNGKKEGRAKIIYWDGAEGTRYYKDDRELN